MIRYFDSRVKRLGIFDMELIQAATMLFAVIIVKLFPRILDIDILWLVALMVLLAARPVYVFYFRNS